MSATDLTQATAAELAALYRSGDASPVEAMTAILARAEVVNPRINALTLIDSEPALAAARLSEARWRLDAPLSPLDGVPVSIKELVRTRGWPHTMASRLTDKAPATEDAPAVARLREAGAVVYAQNTSPEYGFKGVTDSPLHGITRNPWNLEKTPGGSSGGSGAAVAAGLGPLAVGTDGGGSVRIPSAFCSLVGLKATYGRIPAWPPSMHGDLANTGPMTRTTLDCALMLNQMSRPDARDPFPAQPEDKDYTVGLDRGVRGRKIGLVMRFGDVFLDPEIEAGVTAAAKTFERLGAVVEPIAAPPQSAGASNVFVVHWFSALQRLLQLYPAEKHDQFDPQLLQNARVGEQYTVQTLVDAMVARRELSTAWNLLFTNYDLVISPTLNVLPFPVGQPFPAGPDGSPNFAWSNTALFNLTRHPAITTPLGLGASGLPAGLQIVAAHYRDDLVLQASAALEAAQGRTFPVLP
ncbi:MAG TPA: amidase family protein, partial [Caulobacteraceae bacterium]|nr:amidase family protein [Caulobacteraceae bacterium]